MIQPSYRLLISGTRSGRPDVTNALDAFIREHGAPRLVVCCGDYDIKTHKATFRGVDKQGRDWAIKRKLKHIEVLALWHVHDKAAGPIRNGHAVWHCGEGDWLVAFPSIGGDSKGTRDCISQARRAGLQVLAHEVLFKAEAA